MPGFYPGLVKSNLMREASAPIRWISSLFSSTPEKAAQTVIYYALSPEVAGISGRFLKGRQAIASSPYTQDPAVQKRFWEVSLALTSLE